MHLIECKRCKLFKRVLILLSNAALIYIANNVATHWQLATFPIWRNFIIYYSCNRMQVFSWKCQFHEKLGWKYWCFFFVYTTQYYFCYKTTAKKYIIEKWMWACFIKSSFIQSQPGDLSNRHKGIHVTSESDISVLSLNLLQGLYGEYLVYPCQRSSVGQLYLHSCILQFYKSLPCI